MAHANRWQWRPDLIWFDNLTSFGTPNYYVQKLFSNHKGTHLLKLTGSDAPLIGQKQVYASAVIDEQNEKIILKVVNTAPGARKLQVAIQGGQVVGQATRISMSSADLQTENTFDAPRNLVPVEDQVALGSSELNLDLPGQSFSVYRLKLQ
jgi:alpha-N-arabinofuranosidase